MSAAPRVRRGGGDVLAGAYAFFATMVGTTLPTPLYGLYRDQLHFSPLVQTAIFAIYAVAVMLVLVVAGQASDRFGRRPLLLTGLVCAALSTGAFLLPVSLASLFLGRFLSGLSAGLFTGTATTALVELAPGERRRSASLLATAANTLGLGSGPLLAGALAQELPDPLRLPYLVHLALLAPAALLVWRQPETVTGPVADRPPWRLLRPSVPEQARATFLPAAASSFAGFATLGLFTAVEPTFLATILGVSSLLAAGAVAFLIFAVSVAVQALTASAPARVVLPAGCAALVVGMAVLATSLEVASLGVFLVATVVLGAGQGACFRAGVAAVGAAAPDGRGSEVTSTLFVVLYVGISVPVLGVGALSQTAGLLVAGVVFAAFVAVLALLGGVVALRTLRPAP